ncbi:MAG: type 4a pilus biogenesis protein PilO [Planctomycetota bacterium]
MKLTKLDLVTITMAVLVPLGAYFGYFKYRIDKLGTLAGREADLEQQTADDYKTASDISAARSNVRKLQQRIDEFFGSITGQDEANKAVDAILQDAKAAGVHVEIVRPGRAVEGQTLNCMPVSLTASAEFAKLYDFLCRVERGKVVITVERMELESDPLSERCGVKLELRVYFAKPAASMETPA